MFEKNAHKSHVIITWVLLTETISEMKIKKKFNVQEKKKNRNKIHIEQVENWTAGKQYNVFNSKVL